MELIEVAKSVDVRFVKTDPDIIKTISEKTGIDVLKVKQMMRYNIFTINQFADLSQLSLSTVNYKTRPALVKGVLTFELDTVYPFQDAENGGPKFILRNEKAEKYIIG
jgi:hypothetical protein